MPEFKLPPPLWTWESPWKTLGLQWKRGEAVKVVRQPVVFHFPPTLLNIKFVTKRSEGESVDG